MSEKQPTLFDEDPEETQNRRIDELRDEVARQRNEDRSLRKRSESYTSDRLDKDEDAQQRALQGGRDTSSSRNAQRAVGRRGVANAKEALAKALEKRNSTPPRNPNTP